jgi:hypothetical protein
LVANALFKLPNSKEPMGVHDQKSNAILFQMQPMWLKDIKEFL